MMNETRIIRRQIKKTGVIAFEYERLKADMMQVYEAVNVISKMYTVENNKSQ